MKTSYIFKTLLLGFALTTVTSCYDDVEKADYDKPIVKADVLPTVNLSEVNQYGTAAKAVVNIDIPEGAKVLEEGVVIDTIADAPVASTSSSYFACAEVASGEQTVAVTGMEAGKTYYVRAFARVEGQMVYSVAQPIVADDNYEEAIDEDVDLGAEENAAKFTSLKTEESVQQFDLNSLELLFGAPIYGYCNSILNHEALFVGNSAKIASSLDEGVLTYEADFTGKNFPALTVNALNMCSLLGEDFADLSGNFDIYISKEPIESVADLAKAEKLKSCSFPTDASAKDFQMKDFTVSIPLAYDGKCYISFYNKSWTNSALTKGNMGVTFVGLVLTSLHEKAADAE